MRDSKFGRWTFALLPLLLFAIGTQATGGERLADPAPSADRRSDSDSEGAGSDELRKVYTAMGEADSAALFALYKSKDPIVHVLAAMAIERTHFNLDAASKDAQICEDNLSQSKPAIALLCGQFRAGNLRLAGKWRAAMDAEAALVRRYRDRSSELDHRVAELQEFLDHEADVSQFSIDTPSVDVSLPLKKRATEDDFDKTSFPAGRSERDVTQPILSARANGRDFDLLLDTGANDLILDERKARDLGVKFLDEQGVARGWLSTGIKTQRGVLDSLQIGSITLHNAPVTIVPRRNALIGINLLAPLGALRLTDKTLTVYAKPDNVPSCDRDMQVGTDPQGRRLRILPEFLVNDQAHHVMVDTGASSFLIGTQAALQQVTHLVKGNVSIDDIGGRHTSVGAEGAKVRMQIDRQPFNIYFIVYTGSTFPFDIALGAGALKDMDFVFDFRRQSLCFPMHPNAR